ncbi:PsiF family protein [Paracraurococcus lichenis]|uniref:PsiF family protein n=1 Tax=Paracraurococcus lichenis TaxID=3064888 RepID=A0ABT9DTJ4_9PROT|nr:PsiF family protein [Paracraurococcus sp. LOR1-02]MDO9707217.1 PsiF family protein [Paracraurococcus sp. LOR1-02]
MRSLALTLALLSCAALPAMAAESKPRKAPSHAQQAQHERMRQCSATAKERSLHGDPRKAFMKECLAKRAAG